MFQQVTFENEIGSLIQKTNRFIYMVAILPKNDLMTLLLSVKWIIH